MIKKGNSKLHTPNIVRIFDSRDINQCITDIENEQSLHLVEIELEDFGSPKYFKFDADDRYFAITSKTAVLIIDLEDGKIIDKYKIDIEKFSGIYDVMINSYLGNDHDKWEGKEKTARSYRCQIACKLIGFNTVEIFDINDLLDTKQISYFRKGKELKVKISDDFTKVCLTNGIEHYIHNGLH